VFEGDARWRALPIPAGDRYVWEDESTYIAKPPFFDGLAFEPAPVGGLAGLRVLAVLGDSVTTDHISPAGSIAPWSPAGQWLQAHGVGPLAFNSYGARRGHKSWCAARSASIGCTTVCRREAVHRPSPDGEQAHLRRGHALRSRCAAGVSPGGYGSGSSLTGRQGSTLLGVSVIAGKADPSLESCRDGHPPLSSGQ
jgi:aconitate hydratase